MLEMAAGPFPLFDRNADAEVEFIKEPAWVDGLGICGYITGGFWAACKIDGQVLRRQGEGLGFTQQGDIRADLASPTGYREVSYFSDVRDFDVQVGARLEGVVEDGTIAQQYYGLPDRIAVLRTGALRTIPGREYDSGAIETELEVPGTTGEGTMSATGTEGLVAWMDEAGRILFYDYQARAQVGALTGTGMACKHGWWSPALRLWITLHDAGDHDEVRIWTPDPVPAAVSEPETTGEIGPGYAVEFSTTVTGSYGEPVPGIEVSWTASGEGRVSRAVTRTDSQGVARTGYLAPSSTGDAGTLTAEVSA